MENMFQQSLFSLFSSITANPLTLFDKQVKNGHIRRVIDDEIKSLVLELSGTNVATTYVTTPIKPKASLGIKLPFLVMIVKNMKKYFTFEILILDDKDMRRRFRVSNFQSTTKVRPFCTTMPIGLSSGWNQIQFNLADFTRRAYGSTYMETMRVQIHANVRIRRIYFSDRLYNEEELPADFRLFLPLSSQPKKEEKIKEKKEEELTAAPPPPPPPAQAPEGVEALVLEEEMPGAPPTPVEESPVDEDRPAEQSGTEEPPSDVEGEAQESPDEGTTEPTEPPTPSDVPVESEGLESPTEPPSDVPTEDATTSGAESPAPAEDAPPAEPAPEDAPPPEAPAEEPPKEE